MPHGGKVGGWLASAARMLSKGVGLKRAGSASSVLRLGFAARGAWLWALDAFSPIRLSPVAVSSRCSDDGPHERDTIGACAVLSAVDSVPASTAVRLWRLLLRLTGGSASSLPKSSWSAGATFSSLPRRLPAKGMGVRHRSLSGGGESLIAADELARRHC